MGCQGLWVLTGDGSEWAMYWKSYKLGLASGRHKLYMLRLQGCCRGRGSKGCFNSNFACSAAGLIPSILALASQPDPPPPALTVVHALLPPQTSFFFGYMGMACFGFFLMLGTIGWRSSLLFVRHIYKAIKCE